MRDYDIFGRGISSGRALVPSEIATRHDFCHGRQDFLSYRYAAEAGAMRPYQDTSGMDCIEMRV